ncbi:MAG: S24/S26 family peptidase [Polyangiaceae bacterium]
MTVPAHPSSGASLDARGVAPVAVERAVLEMLDRGLAITFVARGGSMARALRSGTKVRVEPCGAGDAHVGEVVAVVRPDGGIRLHRVAARCRRCDAILTWGDGQATHDGWTTRVFGRVRHVDRGTAVPTTFGAWTRRMRARNVRCPCASR